MAKKTNPIATTFLSLAAAGLVLVIIGMCTGVISSTMGNQTEYATLFDKQWADLEQMKPMAEALGLTLPSRTFPIIAFVVAIVGALAVLVNGILSALGKDIKILGLVGGSVAIVGGVLVIVACFILASQFQDIMVIATKGVTTTAGIGAWLGAIGGILAGVAGILGALKVGQKD
ncbi:MAG: hypothetical protein K2F90_01800 [Clostridiales bacterium]|nr:hypothetical protein [Clostridiales bacterium]